MHCHPVKLEGKDPQCNSGVRAGLLQREHPLYFEQQCINYTVILLQQCINYALNLVAAVHQLYFPSDDQCIIKHCAEAPNLNFATLPFL